jgi:MoxR-like ATPase
MILQKFISENLHKEIIIIDEIDKMQMKDQEGLLTMMEREEFTSTKVRNTKTVKANIVIFASSNSTERLSKPLLTYLYCNVLRTNISIIIVVVYIYNNDIFSSCPP